MRTFYSPRSTHRGQWAAPKWLLIASLALLAALPAHAQFTGYVGLQTTGQNVWSSTSCALGGLTLKSAPLQNIGQTVHIVTYTISQTPPLAGPVVYIMGSTDNLTYQRLSDAGIGGGTLVGYGAYPFLSVWVMNGGTGCTITANYIGAQVSNPQPTGSNDSSAYEKEIFPVSSAGTTQTIAPFQTPYGNTAGIFVLTGTTIPAGSTLSVLTAEGSTLDTFAITSGSPSTPEIFLIPSVATADVGVTYTAGGASAGTLTGYYYFFKPGAAQSPGCEQQVVINTAAAGPTQLVAASGGSSVRICSINVSSGTAEAIDFQQGTGTNCGTGNSQLTGLTHLAANGPWIQNFPGGGLIALPGNAVCIHLSAANQTDGTITLSKF
jgi:hypothetical protein